MTLFKNNFFESKKYILKMIKKSEKDSIEGQFRYNLLLNYLPELYCNIKGLNYDGAIKTLKYLERNDHEIYDCYHRLLKTKNVSNLKNLYHKILSESLFMKSKQKIVAEFIEDVSIKNEIRGCMICGSYVSGQYDQESDIDILFLADDREFDMRLIMYKDTLFDCMIVNQKILMELLNQESSLSNILSLSFGLNQKVIIDTIQIQKLVVKATENIQERALSYQKNENKPIKIVDGIPYTLQVEDGIYYLYKKMKKVL